MQKIKLNIKAIRKRLGYTQAEAAELVGLDRVYFSRIESGARRANTDNLQGIAHAFGVTVAELFPSALVPVVGYVNGAGEYITQGFNVAASSAPAEIAAPPGAAKDSVAVAVLPGSLWPIYNAGDILVCGPRSINIEQAIGRRVAVQIKDGPLYFRDVKASATAGRFDIVTYNAPPIEGAAVDWFAPVIWIKPANSPKGVQALSLAALKPTA